MSLEGSLRSEIRRGYGEYSANILSSHDQTVFISKPISGLKAGAFGQEDEWPTLRSGMPFIPRLKSLGFSGMTYNIHKGRTRENKESNQDLTCKVLRGSIAEPLFFSFLKCYLSSCIILVHLHSSLTQ